MTIRYICVALLAAWLACCVRPVHAQSKQDAEQASSPEVIWIKAFIENPTPDGFEFALEAAEKLAKQSQPGGPDEAEVQRLLAEVRVLLERSFVTNWVRGGSSSRLSLEQFADLAKASHSEPFGADRSRLVQLLSTTGVPAGWQHPAFLDWLRRNLPARVNGRDAIDALLRPGFPADPAGRLNRAAFLLEISSDASAGRVRQALHATAQRASAQQMPEYHRRLSELDAVTALKRWSKERESAALRRLLGDRLFELPVDTWHLAGPALKPLVAASSHTPVDFFKKAVGHVRDTRPSWTQNNAGVLDSLGSLCAASTAYDLTEPGHGMDWFEWLHQQSLLQSLHQREVGLWSRSYDWVKRYDAAGEFPRLFPWLRDLYYKQSQLQTQVFNELVRPRAQSGHAELVLGAALQGHFSSDHRETLAVDCLAARNGNGLSAAWLRGSRSRLNVAIDIYSKLMPASGRARRELDQHLNRTLLQDIVDEVLRLIRSDDTAADRTIAELPPLAEHLQACRSRGADTRGSRPIRSLHDEIAQDVDRAMEKLPNEPGDQTPDREEVARLIRRFVRTLSLSFRLRTVLGAALGDSPEWVARARVGLRRRVFGLGDGPASPAAAGQSVLYWSEAATRFRVEMLSQLDGPLRECLKLDQSGDDRAAFWTEIYLPLMRVHGFLKVARTHSKGAGSWPHLAWVLSESGTAQRAARLGELFLTLQTTRWLDADDAVMELAELHRSEFLRATIWCTEPGRLFMGHWGVNANFRIWKRLLDSAAPPPSDDLKLGAIAPHAVAKLEEGILPVGPTFPLKDSLPTTDVHEQFWTYAPWAVNVVTGVEWINHPFLGRSGQPLGWRERVKSIASAIEPFTFKTIGSEVSRSVDGKLRARLATLLLERLAGSASLERQLLTATTVMWLPNDRDNLMGDHSRLAEYLELRQRTYAILNSLLATQTGDEWALVLRHMMWLDVSRRASGQLDPMFDEVLQAMQKAWSDSQAELSSADAAKQTAVASIRGERVELLELLKGESGDKLADARAFVDDKLNAMAPPGMLADARLRRRVDADLANRNYNERLNALTEDYVLRVLRTRKQLKTLAEHAAHAKPDDPSLLEDLKRITRLLELTDCSVFFSRPDFFRPQMIREYYFRRTTTHDARGLAWRPALVVLAWFDTDLQRVATDMCDKLETQPNESTKLLAQDVRVALFQLNESVFGAIRCLTDHVKPDEARQIFDDFRPITLQWRGLNFKLLAESVEDEVASAESLSRDCFQGVLTNVRLVMQGRPASDTDLFQRMFGSLNACLSDESLQRNWAKIGPPLNIDEAARTAARWAEAAHVPSQLKSGIDDFLDRAAGDLLANAETVGGFWSIFTEILSRTRQDRSPRYRKFYAVRLTQASSAHVTFSVSFERGLATPFFKGDVSRQKSDVETILNLWRQDLVATPADPVSDPMVARAFREDSGRVLTRLLKGVGRPARGPYVWKPVDDLAAEKEEVRETPPAEFFAVARWWIGLAKAGDPPPMLRLFQPAEGP